jgi:hypothetical protein
MQVKLTWSYATSPAGTVPTQLVIKHKLASEPDSAYVTQTTITNISTVCNTSTGQCQYTYPAGVLDYNKTYNIAITTDCGSAGTPITSTPVTVLSILCPTVTVSSTNNSVSYSFPGATGTSVTGYVIQLVKNSDNSVAGGPVTVSTIPATVTGSFTGLTASTAYTLRVTVKSSNPDKVCDSPISTGASVSCNGATNLTACICGEGGCTC